MMNDLVNGLFELLAALFVLNHCRVLMRDRAVAGVSVVSVAFFTTLGLWNLLYYPSLGQSFSFICGLFVAAANALYIGMLVYFRRCRSC